MEDFFMNEEVIEIAGYEVKVTFDFDAGENPSNYENGQPLSPGSSDCYTLGFMEIVENGDDFSDYMEELGISEDDIIEKLGELR